MNMGKPRILISDREKSMETESIRNFLESEDIQLHLCTPDNKTSNSDIERLHNTFNEQMRVIRNKPCEEKKFSNPVIEVIVNYNKSIHSATKMRPEDLHHEIDKNVIQKVHENLKQTKLNTLNKVNATRRDQQPDYNYLKNHKTFKLDNIYKKVHHSGIKKDHALIDNKPYYKARFKKSKKKFIPFSSSDNIQYNNGNSGS